MRDFNDVLFNRRSARKFLSTPVEQEKIERIAEAGAWAPSGMNKQPAIILAVTDRALRDQLSKMNAAVMGAEHDPFYGAPAVFVVLAEKSSMTYVYDGSVVMENLLLAAENEGLGACWIHRAKQEFESEEGKEILKKLGITGDYEGIGHVVVGYRDGEPLPAKPRKDSYIYYVK